MLSRSKRVLILVLVLGTAAFGSMSRAGAADVTPLVPTCPDLKACGWFGLGYNLDRTVYGVNFGNNNWTGIAQTASAKNRFAHRNVKFRFSSATATFCLDADEEKPEFGNMAEMRQIKVGVDNSDCS